MILVVDFTSSLEVDEIAFFQYILHHHTSSYWDCALNRDGVVLSSFCIFDWLNQHCRKADPVLRIHHDVVALSSGNHKPMYGGL
jgi:hypothetical protein